MSDFRPCKDCKDWRKCPLTESEKEYFGYQDIRFCSQQVFFLLKYGEIMRGQRWPEPDDSAPGGMSVKFISEATWAKVSLLLAELDERLDRTRLKGDLLREQCQNREKMEYLSDDAKDALYYASGFKRRTMSFVDWLRKRRERHEKRDMAKSFR